MAANCESSAPAASGEHKVLVQLEVCLKHASRTSSPWFIWGVLLFLWVRNDVNSTHQLRGLPPPLTFGCPSCVSPLVLRWHFLQPTQLDSNCDLLLFSYSIVSSHRQALASFALYLSS
ncbi:unnamed protein product [Pipistrellus nathusii]|uniref:Uncharacterized protein n=1 Tax=Pipistrellus nathusii TaxID=59473 RepID=A0ABP0A006_PIPNA